MKRRSAQAHRAIIPGAAVVLVSEVRGSQLPDVFTNAEGEFAFDERYKPVSRIAL
jgi:hypothetical protein